MQTTQRTNPIARDLLQEKNLIVRGLTLSRQEPCDHTVRRFLVEVMGIPAARGWMFSNCHPLERGPKPAIIVRFAFQQQREMVWNKHGILKPTHFYLSEDYPAEVESRRRFMYPIIARSNHLPAYKGKLRIRLDKLLFNGNVYCHDMLHLLPAPINPQTISQIENDQCVAIGGVSSCYNGLGNFFVRNFKHHECQFASTKVNGETYNSIEQGYHHIRALHSNDKKTADLIMKETDPAKQKHISNGIRHVDHKEWENIKDKVMESLMMSKFTEHSDLGKLLTATKDKTIIECNHNDTIFSSGLSIGKHNFDRSNWRGKNMFGVIIGRVRKSLNKN